MLHACGLWDVVRLPVDVDIQEHLMDGPQPVQTVILHVCVLLAVLVVQDIHV
jgi:hypothetical protein